MNKLSRSHEKQIVEFVQLPRIITSMLNDLPSGYIVLNKAGERAYWRLNRDLAEMKKIGRVHREVAFGLAHALKNLVASEAFLNHYGLSKPPQLPPDQDTANIMRELLYANYARVVLTSTRTGSNKPNGETIEMALGNRVTFYAWRGIENPSRHAGINGTLWLSKKEKEAGTNGKHSGPWSFVIVSPLLKLPEFITGERVRNEIISRLVSSLHPATIDDPVIEFEEGAFNDIDLMNSRMKELAAKNAPAAQGLSKKQKKEQKRQQQEAAASVEGTAMQRAFNAVADRGDKRDSQDVEILTGVSDAGDVKSERGNAKTTVHLDDSAVQPAKKVYTEKSLRFIKDPVPPEDFDELAVNLKGVYLAALGNLCKFPQHHALVAKVLNSGIMKGLWLEDNSKLTQPAWIATSVLGLTTEAAIAILKKAEDYDGRDDNSLLYAEQQENVDDVDVANLAVNGDATEEAVDAAPSRYLVGWKMWNAFTELDPVPADDKCVFAYNKRYKGEIPSAENVFRQLPDEDDDAFIERATRVLREQAPEGSFVVGAAGWSDTGYPSTNIVGLGDLIIDHKPGSALTENEIGNTEIVEGQQVQLAKIDPQDPLYGLAKAAAPVMAALEEPNGLLGDRTSEATIDSAPVEESPETFPASSTEPTGLLEKIEKMHSTMPENLEESEASTETKDFQFVGFEDFDKLSLVDKQGYVDSIKGLLESGLEDFEVIRLVVKEELLRPQYKNWSMDLSEDMLVSYESFITRVVLGMSAEDAFQVTGIMEETVRPLEPKSLQELGALDGPDPILKNQEVANQERAQALLDLNRAAFEEREQALNKPASEPEEPVEVIDVKPGLLAPEDIPQDGDVSKLATHGAVIAKGPIVPGTEYTVLSGDSLWKLATRAYGDGELWDTIYQANKSIIENPDLIYPGQVLQIPPLAVSA